MNKNFFIMTVTALILALGMSQSMMAKKVLYMGHEYDGKVNKEKIPEGNGKIQIGELSISGNFNGSVITDASFNTTWLSYKGDVIFYNNNTITLKDGGTITLNIYNGGSHFDFNEIEHQDVDVEGDMDVDYQKLKFVPYQLSIPIEPLDERLKSLNPPTDTTINVLPEDHTYWFKISPNGTIGDRKYFIYSRNIHPRKYREYNLRPYNGGLCATLNNYKDSEGRVWKRDGQGYKVTFPDGSYCDYSTGYKRVSSDISIFISESLYKLILPNGIIIYHSNKGEKTDEYLNLGNKAPYRLKVVTSNRSYDGICDNAESYVRGENKKIQINRSTELEIYKGNGDAFNDYGRIKQIFNDSILPYLTIDNDVITITRKEPDPDRENVYTLYTALEYKDGVVKTEDQIKKENDRIATEKADAYRKALASFKKKYGFDPNVNDLKYIVKVGRNSIGVIDARNEWLKEYGEPLRSIHVKLVKDQGTSKCYEFFSNAGAFYCGYFWVRNNVITSIYWGPKRFGQII